MGWRIGMVAVFALAGSVLPLATSVSSVPKPPFSMVKWPGQEQIQLEQEARLITVKILSNPRQKRDRSFYWISRKLSNRSKFHRKSF